MAKQLIIEKKVMDAPVLSRVLAFAADLLILNLVIWLPFRTLLAKLIPQGDFREVYTLLAASPALIAKLSTVYFFMGLLAFVYFTFSELRLGQSIGKALFGLHVVSDQKPSFMQIGLRNLFCFPVFPFPLLWIIDPLALGFTKRRASDMLTKTRVVLNETGLRV
jgi:uncharacterized RDD family membrane protein YckC